MQAQVKLPLFRDKPSQHVPEDFGAKVPDVPKAQAQLSRADVVRDVLRMWEGVRYLNGSEWKEGVARLHDYLEAHGAKPQKCACGQQRNSCALSATIAAFERGV